MDEDSKGLANAGSFGASFHFHSHEPMPTDEFIKIMSEVVRNIGLSTTKPGSPIMGHIKAFVSTPQGYLKLNLIDMDLGVEQTNTIGSASIKEGEIKVMAALMGVPDHKVEEAIGKNIMPLAKHFELEMDKHEDHDHHEHDYSHRR